MSVAQPPQRHGVKCPQCGELIEVSIAELLQLNAVNCGYCGLKLSIDRQKSKAALTALDKVKRAQENVQKTSKFNR